MGKDLLLSLGGDVEEGEISDSASVEEISAEDFSSKPPALRSEIKSEITASKNASIDESKQQQSQKVWTMQDLVKYQKKYQMSRNYAPGLYNFAWAQAVQNKPLDDYLTTINNSNTTDNNSKQSNNDDDNKIVMDITGDDADSEKEEGELEEGEIDLDMEVLNKQGEGDDLDKRIDVIRIGLEGITLNDAKNSFVGVCSRFEDSMDSLSTLLSETSVSNKDDLVQLAFSAIQLVHSVFCGMSQSQKEQCRHLISRMLNNVKGYMPVILSPEQLKEIDNMIMSSTTEESVLDPIRIETQDQNANQSEPLKTQTSISKNRVLLPLLDLHKDHDLDSLPSPTRETTNSLPLGKGPFIDNTAIRPEWPTPRAVIHRYETDALKAVSTYQQKFGKSSFFSSDLPSPTPSEDSGGDAGGDTGGEISSFSTESEKREIFSSPHVERNNTQLFSNARTAAPVYSTSSSVTRVSNKTRDPRLRLANSDNFSDSVKQPTIEPFDGLSDLRKQKSLDDSVSVDGPAPKRLKNEFSDSVSLRNIGSVTVTQNRGIETGVTTSSLPSTSSGSVQIPVTGVSATSASLQSILKDIAVNPAQWMNLIKMEQQKSVDPSKSVTQSLSQNSFMGSMPMSATVSQPLVVGQRSTTEMQTPQIASSDDSAKVRMKPRDPRRALHNKSLQKTEQNTNVTNTEGNKVKSKKLDPRISPQPNSATDITRQFTKNLKNIADIVSTTVSSSTQIPSSQSAQAHSSYVNIKGLSSQTGRVQNGPTSEEGSAGQSQSNNTWENVEQYFGRFDDQQRAAIQRERTKRMEEQKKMFADRKLCLVLDLDHTLLNSAKFCEIEPVHDEILRKKEQEDRDKPYRHLFRFPHMGMWTKLRPGIWNFLEKTSKLFELHLYTMGNKVYATEMAKLVDPKGVLFNGRVISKGDDGDSVDGEPKSKDLEGVLGMESAVVIIDDSVRVWPHNKLNLIAVERYIYFPCSRRQFGLPGPSLLEIDRPEDGTLASSLAVIEKIHRNFFMEKCLDEADVRNILASEQRKILGGCRIVFSRVFPVGEAAPHMHPLWQTAQQFGAVCTNQIDEHVTHVVANSLGTDKVNWALATGRPVVHPGWVEASALLYRRANEHDFAVQP